LAISSARAKCSAAGCQKRARDEEAVAVSRAHILAEKNGGRPSQGKIVARDREGDVHDIGKNMSACLSCNNFDVYDMAVMIPCEKILAKAREVNADADRLSGLIRRHSTR